jgi:cyclohexyl-isocyanide hydratase
MEIGALLYPRIDQADFTGPFEVLVRVPESRFHTIWKEAGPLRDHAGLILTAETTFAAAPPLDVLVVPGGSGVDALLEDEETLAFIRRQAAGARYVLSICTGALLCGAAGLLEGKRATTHWTALELLPLFGATAVRKRVVEDGRLITAAGVTSGIDGALRLFSLVRGREAAERVQLAIEYEPAPPFASGSPQSAPPEVLEAVQRFYQPRMDARRALVERIAAGRRAARAAGL